VRPLLSLVIPTRDLPDIPALVVRQVLSIPSCRIEVIVRDSSHSPVLGEQLKLIGDNRLRYEYSAPVSMTENWNRAAQLATGEYVCFIGHDDGVNPEIIKIAEWASNVHADAVVFPYSAVYYWPDFPNKRYAGRLFLGKCSGEIRSISARQQLMRYIRTTDPITLPRIYHGLVRRECLEVLRNKTGQYFHTPAVDDYFSYAICANIKNYYYVHFPGTIAGKCRGSDSGLYELMGNNSVNVSRYSADERVYDRRSPPNTKTEANKIHALVTALRHFDDTDLIEKIEDGQRYAAWYALSLRLRFPDLMRSIRHLCTKGLEDKTSLEKAKICGRVARYASEFGMRKLYRNVIQSSGGHALMISDCAEQSVHIAQDIGQASEILQREVGKQAFGEVDKIMAH